MNTPACGFLRRMVLAPLLALSLAVSLALTGLHALPAQAQEKAEDHMVGKQELLDKLGGAAPAQDAPLVINRRGPAGVKSAAEAAPAPKEIAISIHFKTNSAELADEFSRRQLREIAEALSLPELKTLRLEIGGHTDSLGSDAGNLALSRRRAQAVKDALCKGGGVGCGRLSVKGYGKSEPLASNDDEEGRAKNRRVVLKRLD